MRCGWQRWPRFFGEAGEVGSWRPGGGGDRLDEDNFSVDERGGDGGEQAASLQQRCDEKALYWRASSLDDSPQVPVGVIAFSLPFRFLRPYCHGRCRADDGS